MLLRACHWCTPCGCMWQQRNCRQPWDYVLLAVQAQSLDADFTVTGSGLKVLDVRPGEGATPKPGDTVVVHWSGYTKGYQVGNCCHYVRDVGSYQHASALT